MRILGLSNGWYVELALNELGKFFNEIEAMTAVYILTERKL